MAGWSRWIVFKVTMVLVAASLVSSEAQSELQSLRGELIHRSHFSSPSSWNLAISRSRRDLIAVKPMPAPKETSNSFMANMSLAPHEYLMSVSLGTPPQDFVAVISTGTDLTWIQCEDCESCVNRSLPTFKPALSSSYSTIKCNSIACSDLSLKYDTVGRAVCLLNFSNCDYNFFYDSVSNTSGTLAHETIHLRTAHSALTEPMTYFSFGCSRNSYSNSGLYDGASGVVG